GTFGEEVLMMFQEYDYVDGAKIQFTKLNFFISELALVSAGSDESKTELSEINNIDLSFDRNNPTDAANGVTLTIKDIPVGNYSGLSVGFGVAADLNRTKPVDYGAGHPLRSNFWDGWSSYIFSVIEGGFDMNNNGEIVLGGSESEGFTYHSGTDELYQDGFIAQSIELKAGETARVNLKLDAKELFKNNNPTYDTNGDGYLDIELFSGTHSDTFLEVARQIMVNFGNAISL
ncbi:MAG: MbnP family protein, partial [Bacteroidota bacterium]